jgi:hypothetical protein
MPKKPNKVVVVDPFNPFLSERELLQRFMAGADKFDAKHTRSKEAALKQLQKEGVLTKTGRLTQRYGG